MASTLDDILAGGILVAFDYHGVAATHAAAEGGATTAVTVIPGDEEVLEQDDYASRRRAREHRRVFALRTSEIAEPKRGDSLTVDSIEWAVVGVEAMINGVALLVCERLERVHSGARRI